MIVLVFINDLWIGKAECSGGGVPILSQPSAYHDAARQQEEARGAALHTEKAIVIVLLSLLVFVCADDIVLLFLGMVRPNYPQLQCGWC